MSEQEFEVYLSLLSRFLNLKPGQREEIADELRDHLDERLDELAREGKSRDEAVRLALDEFGDAASLAARFSHLASRRKRRFIMKCTFGSICVTAVAVLIAVAIWPGGDGNHMAPRAAAQQSDGEPDFGDAFLPPPANKQGRETGERAAVEKKLSTTMDKVEFVDIPLEDALLLVGESAQVDILVNGKSLSEAGVDLSEPITLVLKHAKVSAGTVLELILERASGEALTHRIRDGFVYVDTEANSEDELELQVYNCRDLIGEYSEVIMRPAQARGLRGGGEGAGGMMGTEEGMFGGEGGAMPGMSDMGGLGPRHAQSVAVQAAADTLIEVIEKATSGHWESIDGVGGSIMAFNGLLVVQQTQQVHQEIDNLLEMMRAAEKDKPKPKRKGGPDKTQKFAPGFDPPGLSS